MNRVVTSAALAATLAVGAMLFGCNKSSASTDPGAGASDPVAALKVPEITYSTAQADLDKGKELFQAKGCNGCHKIGGGKLVGPDLKGVTARRDKQWIAKMILRPDVMVKEDPTAKDLFKTYLTAMPNQGVPEGDLPALMSYLKANE
ncbi:MAG: cytochrome c [Deltaproteobacteria bacterium]|nr:cytochrome c [Deltaproteobacteria bacterium]